MPGPQALANNSGMSGTGAGEHYPRQNSLEVNVFQVNCSDVARFIDADNQTWTGFLRMQLGFISKTVYIDPHMGSANNAGICNVWTMTLWLSGQLWHAIPGPELARTAERFAKVFGRDVTPHRYPSAAGLDVLRIEPTLYGALEAGHATRALFSR